MSRVYDIKMELLCEAGRREADGYFGEGRVE